MHEDSSVLNDLKLWNEKVVIPAHKKNVSKKTNLNINDLPLFIEAKVRLISLIVKYYLLNNC
jgi:hypothetical protein